MDWTQDIIGAISSEPPGTFKLYRATEEQPEVEQSIRNMDEFAKRVKHAKASNCLIEVISLRLQYMDMWLRIFFENTPHHEKRQQEFGRLLKQCLHKGLNKLLYDKIYKFNKERVNAIHGYLIGALKYDDLTKIISTTDGLSEDLTEFVILNSGTPMIENAEGGYYFNRGDRILCIPDTIYNLRSRDPT